MPWIDQHKTVWRVAILVVLLVAVLGPWTFDVTWVPPEYSCSAPSIRLDNNYCGTPEPGTRFFRMLVSGTVYASARLVTGPGDIAARARESLVGLILLLLVLPVFSTLLLILGGDRRCRQVLNAAAWGLAACWCLLMGLFTHPRLFWVCGASGSTSVWQPVR